MIFLVIPNLDKKHACELISYFIKRFNLEIDDLMHFTEEDYNISCGNPSAIKEICRYAMKSRYKIAGKIYFNLIRLDREIDSLNL